MCIYTHTRVDTYTHTHTHAHAHTHTQTHAHTHTHYHVQNHARDDSKSLLETAPVLVILVGGGVTFQETRAAYSLSKTHKRLVLIGGTELAGPRAFVRVLHCNTLQHTATHWNALQRTVMRCNALQRTAAHCNALQRTGTHCNALQRTAIGGAELAGQRAFVRVYAAAHCNALQCTVTHCNAL